MSEANRSPRLLKPVEHCLRLCVVPGRLELPTSTLSVWRSNQLSYRTGFKLSAACAQLHSFSISKNRSGRAQEDRGVTRDNRYRPTTGRLVTSVSRKEVFQPHLPVRLPCYDLAPITCIALGRASTATDFRRPRLSWLDGRCVQGPGTYSPRHG